MDYLLKLKSVKLFHRKYMLSFSIVIDNGFWEILNGNINSY